MKKFLVKLIPYEEIYTLEVEAQNANDAGETAVMYLNDGNDLYCVKTEHGDDVIVHSVEEKAA